MCESTQLIPLSRMVLNKHCHNPFSSEPGLVSSTSFLGLCQSVWLFGESHHGVVFENLALCQQRSILKRKQKRPRLVGGDRWFGITLFRQRRKVLRDHVHDAMPDPPDLIGEPLPSRSERTQFISFAAPRQGFIHARPTSCPWRRRGIGVLAESTSDLLESISLADSTSGGAGR